MKESKAGNNEASAATADDAGKYPGVAIDVADGDETNAVDVKERTLTLCFRETRSNSAVPFYAVARGRALVECAVDYYMAVCHSADLAHFVAYQKYGGGLG